ncbi:MAG: hypothetical protein WC755_00975 [Candidatus Woesearchaeota archaeon]|jgi:hypothetical protein
MESATIGNTMQMYTKIGKEEQKTKQRNTELTELGRRTFLSKASLVDRVHANGNGKIAIPKHAVYYRTKSGEVRFFSINQYIFIGEEHIKNLKPIDEKSRYVAFPDVKVRVGHIDYGTPVFYQ